MSNLSSKQHYLIAAGVGVVLTGLSYLVALLFGWVTPETTNWLEMSAVATSYACTYLFIVQKRAAYLVGMVTTAIYVTVFFQASLVASAILNAYLVITLIYGWFAWGRDDKTLPVKHWPLKWIPVYILVSAVLYTGAVLLATAFGGTFAPADSVILAMTILAQLMTDRKVIEAWWVWAIGVNIAGTIVYALGGLPFVSMQQFIFGVASVVTGFVWLAEYRRIRRGKSGTDMRDTPVDNPFDFREDGSIRPGDPAWAAMMEMMESGKPQHGVQREDGTWDVRSL